MILSKRLPQATCRGQQRPTVPSRVGLLQQHRPAVRHGPRLHAAPPDGPIMSQDQVLSDPANTMIPPDQEQKPLVEQVEEERADEDRETFITESGLVEEVEEEDAKV